MDAQFFWIVYDLKNEKIIHKTQTMNFKSPLLPFACTFETAPYVDLFRAHVVVTELSLYHPPSKLSIINNSSDTCLCAIFNSWRWGLGHNNIGFFLFAFLFGFGNILFYKDC